jgi:beta-xylosidase
MSPDGMQILDNGVSIYRDTTQPTIEGPKFLKKDGYYYILAPAGGVPSGWQTVLRSKNIYGPYEAEIVLQQGNTEVNGPHQGGLIELPSGESWFIHFQDKDTYGRIVHLQPVRWIDGWPRMGVDINNDGIGEPVTGYKKPDVGNIYPVAIPQTSDEFNEEYICRQWQWHANPGEDWYSFRQGKIQLNAVRNISQQGDLWMAPNLLLQKFPSPEFIVTTRIEFNPQLNGEQAGLLIMGEEWAFLAFEKQEDSIRIGMYEAIHNRCDPGTKLIEKVNGTGAIAYFRVTVKEGGLCSFSYSPVNADFIPIGKEFQAQPGKWIGAKVGLFSINPNIEISNGFALFDWFRFDID